MMIGLAFGLSFWGFLHFAMSVRKHHMEVYQRWGKVMPLSQREYCVMQGIGWLLMALSYRCAVINWGVGVGTMAWLLLLTVSALLLVGLLSYRLLWLQRLWRIVGLGGWLAPPRYQ